MRHHRIGWHAITRLPVGRSGLIPEAADLVCLLVRGMGPVSAGPALQRKLIDPAAGTQRT